MDCSCIESGSLVVSQSHTNMIAVLVVTIIAEMRPRMTGRRNNRSHMNLKKKKDEFPEAEETVHGGANSRDRELGWVAFLGVSLSLSIYVNMLVVVVHGLSHFWHRGVRSLIGTCPAYAGCFVRQTLIDQAECGEKLMFIEFRRCSPCWD